MEVTEGEPEPSRGRKAGIPETMRFVTEDEVWSQA